MRRELHAEWTKLRTLPGTGWLLASVVALTVGLGAAADALAGCPWRGCGHDPARLALGGVQLGQAAIAMLAVLIISGEYGTGLIRATLTAMPRRIAVLAAKATLVTGLALASGSLAVLGALLAGRLILPGSGFTAEHGYTLAADGPTLRAALGSVLYLALVGLLGLGVGAAVRDSAAAIGVTLGLLYGTAALPYLVGDPDWQRLLWRISPMNAGLAVQATRDLAQLPLGPWQGLGVPAAWAAAALAAGAVALTRRDA
ncbi:ABC transporter permease [Thermoactinospora rubra]|uniref:ABC transporter permease n=1 Tax=Thermoactinospora rubra TaxID=1088767 RepID=UPI000A10DEFF|nr:ABC transporter permease [Thermoactinospora rubra]